MPRLSILVPYWGANELFEATLASVLQNRPDACEVLVVHAGPYSDPWNLTDEVEFIEQRADASLVDLLNAGLESARAELLHVLLGGVEVGDDWTAPVLRHLDDPSVAAISPLVCDRGELSRVVSRGVAMSTGGRRVTVGAGESTSDASGAPGVLGPSLRAAFYRTDTLLDLGGFEPTVGERFIDVDLALTMSAVGLRCVHEPRSKVTSAPEREPAYSFRDGRGAERLFWRHIGHRGWFSSLLAHPLTALTGALGDLPHPGAVTQLIGRAVAMLEWSRFSSFRAELQELVASFEVEPAAAPRQSTPKAASTEASTPKATTPGASTPGASTHRKAA